jgi:hypothetical protein
MNLNNLVDKIIKYGKDNDFFLITNNSIYYKSAPGRYSLLKKNYKGGVEENDMGRSREDIRKGSR